MELSLECQQSLERQRHVLRDHRPGSAYTTFYDAKMALLREQMKVFCPVKQLEIRLANEQIEDPTEREAAKKALHYYCQKSNRKNHTATNQKASKTMADKKIQHSTPTKIVDRTCPGFRSNDPCVFKITTDSFKLLTKIQEHRDQQEQVQQEQVQQEQEQPEQVQPEQEPLSICNQIEQEPLVTLLEINADDEVLAMTSTEQTPESSQQPTPTVIDLAPTPSPVSNLTPVQDLGLVPLAVPLDRCDRPPKLSKKTFLTPASIKEGVTSFENPPGVQRSTGYVFNNNEDFDHDVNLRRTKMEWTVEEICGHKRKRGGRGRGGVHFKVQWSDGSRTWEPKRNITTHAKGALDEYCDNKDIDSNGNKKPRRA